MTQRFLPRLHRSVLAAAALAALAACQDAKPVARGDASREAAAPVTDAGPADAPAPDAPRVVALEDVPLPDAAMQTAAEAVAGSPTGTTLDLPTAQAWPAVNRWNDAMEREYAEFVHRLGAAVEARRCGRLDACLRNPEVNILYDAATERRLSLDVDCADLPYILRGYFAFKRRLPFGYVDLVWGSGPDPRYMLRVRPTKWRQWNDYRTPRSSLRHISEAVHSGMYRINPDHEQGDF